MKLPDGVDIRLFPGDGLVLSFLPGALPDPGLMRDIRRVTLGRDRSPEEKAAQIRRILLAPRARP